MCCWPFRRMLMPKLDAPFDLRPFADIYYPPVTSLSLGFSENQFTHPLNGFGMLIPKVENRYSLGALFPSSIFPERAPGGMVLLTVFIGGSMAPEKALQDEDDNTGECAQRPARPAGT